jgi:MoaA/NifB/PqqE/SkfB family radical SAM enzyme
MFNRLKQWFDSSPSDPRGTYPDPQLKDIILFVTDRCNMKCDHCMFWERIDQPGDEHSLHELELMAASVSPLRTVSITGGEPFLRNDLNQIIETFYRDNHSHHVQVNTNGLLMKRMEDLVTSDLALKYEHYLTFQVSIDGPEEQHDKVRCMPGSFKKIVENLKRLVDLKAKHPFFRPVVLTNINRSNYEYIEDIAKTLWDEVGVEHAYDMVRGESFSAWGIPDSIRQQEDPRDSDLPPMEKMDGILAAIKRINEREGGVHGQCVQQLETQINLYKGIPAPFKCLSAGRTIGVVYSDGSVAACEFTTPFGNLADHNYDLGKLWASEMAEHRRKQITGCSCCHSCFVLTSLVEWEEQRQLQNAL